MEKTGGGSSQKEFIGEGGEDPRSNKREETGAGGCKQDIKSIGGTIHADAQAWGAPKAMGG